MRKDKFSFERMIGAGLVTTAIGVSSIGLVMNIDKNSKRDTEIEKIVENVKPVVNVEPQKPVKKEIIRKKKVVIDAGHGMSSSTKGLYDPGALSEDYYEADITLIQANKIKEILEEKGYEVLLTRTDNETDCSLDYRKKFAKDIGADAFVSLHCNSFGDKSVHGQEVFYWNNKSISLAESVKKGLLDKISQSGFETNDRGLKKRKLRVTNTDIPAILVESGFLSNNKDKQYLTDNNYDVEKGIAEGIDKYLSN